MTRNRQTAPQVGTITALKQVIEHPGQIHVLLANLATRRVLDRPAVVPTSAESCLA